MNVRALVTDNFWLKVLSVLLALGAWLVAQGEKVHRVTVDVPVRYVFPEPSEDSEISSRLVVMNDTPLPREVRLQLSGTRVAISSFVAEQSDLEYRVDLREAGPGAIVESFRIPPVELGREIVLDTVSPAEVGIVLDDVDAVTVPVRIRRRGALRDGFRELRSRVNPEEVRLVGSKTDLAKLDFVETVALRMGELDESGYLDALALDLGGLHLLPESPVEVRVSIEVERELQERQFDGLEIAVDNGFSGLRVNPSRCSVRIQGPPDLVSSLSVRDLRASLSGNPALLELAAGGRAPVMALLGKGTGETPAVRVWLEHPRADELRLSVEPQSFVVRSEAIPPPSDPPPSSASPSP